MSTGRNIPQRSCVSCGKKLSKRELIRVVRTPKGGILADPTGKMAGRGAYLCWSEACWTRGMGKGALERSLKVNLSIQDRAQLSEFYKKTVTGSPSKE